MSKPTKRKTNSDALEATGNIAGGQAMAMVLVGFAIAMLLFATRFVLSSFGFESKITTDHSVATFVAFGAFGFTRLAWFMAFGK